MHFCGIALRLRVVARFNPNAPWPERDAELRRLHSTGLSYRQIAERMKLSKSSVLARATRIGLPRRENTPARDIQRKERRERPRIYGSAPTLPPLPSLRGGQ
jgi:hypothetical protein